MSPMTSKQRLRELGGLRPDGHMVLSVYLNLDPSEFPTQRDRRIEIESLLDVAERGLREDGIEHRQREELKRDVERVRSWFEREFDASGTRGVAVFAASGIDLFDVHHLSRPIPSEVTIDDSPFIEPLAGMPGGDGYGVLLINRQAARVLAGGADGMREVVSLVDDVHRWHDQGGWSQARYQRGIEKEKDDHLKHTVEVLMKHFKRRPFQHLIVGGPREVVADFESKLHGYLSERLAGRIEVDVDNSSPEQVLQAARLRFEEIEDAREGDALERIGESGRAVTGLDEVLRVLNERRVECLLLDEQFAAGGTTCPDCGWLGPESERTCPVDGRELTRLEDLTDTAIELSLQQSAEIMAIRHRRDEFEERAGGIAALLRF